MMADPTPDPSSAWWVTMFLPFSPKISTRAVCTRSGNLGYFYTSATVPPDPGTHVVQRPIGSNSTSFLKVSLLANNSSNTTSRQPSSPSSNQSSQFLEELPLFICSFQSKEMGEYTNNSQQLVGRIGFHERQECSVECVGFFELVGVLSKEEISVIDEFAENESEDFSEVETGNHLFERLLSGLVGGFINDDVELCSG
jgi:hypothetical protein